jgi:hypothetical protein
MSGADTNANSLYATLTSGVSFTLPTPDLSASQFQLPITAAINADILHLANSDLTSGVQGGAGTFDVLMKGVKAQLEGEYKAGRITGAEYTKAYIALTEQAIQGSIQFLLGRDQAYWQAVVAQTQAITARTQAETAKAQLALARYQAEAAKADYALTKLKLATEGMQYDTLNYTLSNILPAQKLLLGEQMEAQRAQSTDMRSDGATVGGLLGKQKALYEQQILSYRQDAMTKGAKIFSDAWTVLRTTDDAMPVPDGFSETNLNAVLASVRTALSI